MAANDAAEFSRALAARGWRYDPAAEEFSDGERVPDWEAHADRSNQILSTVVESRSHECNA